MTSILLICFLVLTGCTSKQEETVQKQTVKHVYTKMIESSGYSDKLTLSGNIIPTQTVKLSFKIPGIVSNVLVNEGDFVQKGQAIAEMNQGDYLIKVKAAQAELKAARLQIQTEIPARINQAKAQYDLTKISYDRVKTLFEHEAVSKSQLDEISAKLTVDENTYHQAVDAKVIAETKLEMAEASLDLANSNITDTIIYSPINGVILQKVVETGETTDAGYPIVAIGEVDKVWSQIGVPDEHINLLHIGQKADVYIYGIDKSVEGIVAEITSLADTKTRTFPVKILINNFNGELKPGMISKVDIRLSDSEKILIPLSSVMHLSAGSAVYIYLNDTQTVSKRIIETGEILKDRIEVIKGLEHGEKVIVEGQFVLRDGDKVTAEEMIE
ncbi:MAG: efflux RND transporter periplasmic adaptor subunit [Clostridia bacterium]